MVALLDGFHRRISPQYEPGVSHGIGHLFWICTVNAQENGIAIITRYIDGDGTGAGYVKLRHMIIHADNSVPAIVSSH